MKKILFLIAIILTFSSTALAAFSDMPTNEIYSTAINELVNEKVINGYEDNTFRPETKITRAEFSKMIVLANDISETKENTFSDVPTNHWATKYINSVYASKLVEGYEDGTFKPEKNITYGEISTILVRVMGYEEKVKENKLIWPLNYMHVAESLGLFQGWNTNDLLAENPATRANTALMIYNMLNAQNQHEEDSSEKIDTKKAYAGFVIGRKTRAGIKYITIDNGYEEIEYELSSKAEFPELESFIIYQLKSDGKLNLRKEILLADKDEDSLLVKDVEEIFIEFEGIEKVLDLELDIYVLNEKEIKLNKYNYFILEIEDDEFTSFELVTDKEKLKLKKDDKVKFDNKLNVCYIFREI
ncbi:MAG: S-layer homology domain-containing protein [Clostridia bacterium]|nr:S-layer homology domain-containing protein [Clostridia bacterium]